MNAIVNVPLRSNMKLSYVYSILWKPKEKDDLHWKEISNACWLLLIAVNCCFNEHDTPEAFMAYVDHIFIMMKP